MAIKVTFWKFLSKSDWKVWLSQYSVLWVTCTEVHDYDIDQLLHNWLNLWTSHWNQNTVYIIIWRSCTLWACLVSLILIIDYMWHDQGEWVRIYDRCCFWDTWQRKHSNSFVLCCFQHWYIAHNSVTIYFIKLTAVTSHANMVNTPDYRSRGTFGWRACITDLCSYVTAVS